MNSNALFPDAARSLVETLYSPQTFEQLCSEWKRLLTEHYDAVHRGDAPVLNWDQPESLIRQADEWMRDIPELRSEEQLVTRFRAIVREALSHGQNLHHPRYTGHQVPAPVPAAGLMDAVGALTNQVMAIYEMGPWATAVEHAVLRRLCAKAGWSPEESSGLLTHGGSLANLTALLTARNVSFPNSSEDGIPDGAVILVQSDSHYCVTRSASILGLGSRAVRRIALDADRRMDVADLRRQLQCAQQEKRPVLAVCAAACSTPTGAFDPLTAVADVCEEFDVWMHVDAAHGGSVLMSRRHRHLLNGIERADSIVWDAHKLMFVPALCTAVLFRRAEHRFTAFEQDAPYLFDPAAPGLADYDSGMRTVECTKRAAAFGLWAVWALTGEQFFEQAVDHVFSLARLLHQMTVFEDDFEALHVPECNILVFRWIPPSPGAVHKEGLSQVQSAVRQRIIESGRFYLVQTTIEGETWLRVALMNPVTTTQDLAALLDEIRTVARDVLEAADR